ncbi:MAG: sigma-70 family RNA polymerase sigma factor [Verrucomicrobiota bacterium]
MASADEEKVPEKNPDEFVALSLANQTRIRRFILSLISNREDAEDVYQKTSVVLWKKFDQYEPGTSFASWAMRVAYYEICDYRKKLARARVTFSQELFDKLADQVREVSLEEDVRRDALDTCLQGLNENNRELVRLRYLEDLSMEDVAKQIKRPTKTVYRILQKVRSWLQHCIETRITSEGGKSHS